MLVVVKRILWVLLVVLIQSAQAANQTNGTSRLDPNFLENQEGPENPAFWDGIFTTGGAGLTDADFANHVSPGERIALSRHLAKDPTIPISLLSALADFATSYLQRDYEPLANVSLEDRGEAASKMLMNLDLWYSRLMTDLAKRPEIDLQFAGKILAQMEAVRPLTGWDPRSPLAESPMIAIARNTNTPVAVLNQLSDSQLDITRELLLNLNLPTNIVWRMLGEAERTEMEISRVPQFNPLPLPYYNTDEIIERAKVNLASRSTTPESVLARLVTDPRDAVRRAAFANTNTPSSALVALTNDPQIGFTALLALGASPRTPAETLWQLGRSGDEQLTQSVALNSAAPDALLAELLNNKDYLTWTQVFEILARRNPPPKELLRSRWNNADRTQRSLLLIDKGLPSWVRTEFTNSR